MDRWFTGMFCGERLSNCVDSVRKTDCSDLEDFSSTWIISVPPYLRRKDIRQTHKGAVGGKLTEPSITCGSELALNRAVVSCLVREMTSGTVGTI